MEQQGKTENNGNSRLETGNIWKLMLSLSIPSIIAQLVGILYNMVDRMFIGRIEISVIGNTVILPGICRFIPTIVGASSGIDENPSAIDIRFGPPVISSS